MKDNAVKHIANKLNISKATASRAIRHCSGVDSDTRQNVLDEARIINYQLESECAIYAILPDTPQYFWKEMQNGIRAEKRSDVAPVKGNIYTNLNDENVVLTYLDEAERLNAFAIIIAAHITPKIQDKLATMTEGRMILILSEYHELTNAFFVGGDAYQDGYLMGKQYLSCYTDKPLIILSSTHSRNIQRRLAGFRKAVEEENAELIRNAKYIDVDRKILKDPKLLPSKLAPLLVEASKGQDSLCIYSPLGIPQLPLVLTKAKITDKVVCMCHDYFPDKKDSCIAVTCNQDVIAQGHLAIKLATHFVVEQSYPDKKFNLIPSIINRL